MIGHYVAMDWRETNPHINALVDTIYTRFDQSTPVRADAWNLSVADIAKVNESAGVLGAITGVNAKRVLLESELKKNFNPLVASVLLTILSLTLALVTRYWVIAFLLAVPFAIRFIEHELTLRTALKRVTDDREQR